MDHRYKTLGSIVYTLQSDDQSVKEIHTELGQVYSLYYSLILFCNILILLLFEYVVLRPWYNIICHLYGSQ
jgi:hypothetical protein